MIKFEILSDRVEVYVPYEATVNDLTKWEESLIKFFPDAENMTIIYNRLPEGYQTT